MLRVLSSLWVMPLLGGLLAGSLLLVSPSPPPVGVVGGSLPVFLAYGSVSPAPTSSADEEVTSSPTEGEPVASVSASPQVTTETTQEVAEFRMTLLLSLLVIAGFVALIAGILVTRSH